MPPKTGNAFSQPGSLFAQREARLLRDQQEENRQQGLTINEVDQIFVQEYKHKDKHAAVKKGLHRSHGMTKFRKIAYMAPDYSQYPPTEQNSQVNETLSHGEHVGAKVTADVSDTPCTTWEFEVNANGGSKISPNRENTMERLIANAAQVSGRELRARRHRSLSAPSSSVPRLSPHVPASLEPLAVSKSTKFNHLGSFFKKILRSNSSKDDNKNDAVSEGLNRINCPQEPYAPHKIFPVAKPSVEKFTQLPRVDEIPVSSLYPLGDPNYGRNPHSSDGTALSYETFASKYSQPKNINAMILGRTTNITPTLNSGYGSRGAARVVTHPSMMSMQGEIEQATPRVSRSFAPVSSGLGSNYTTDMVSEDVPRTVQTQQPSSQRNSTLPKVLLNQDTDIAALTEYMRSTLRTIECVQGEVEMVQMQNAETKTALAETKDALADTRYVLEKPVAYQLEEQDTAIMQIRGTLFRMGQQLDDMERKLDVLLARGSGRDRGRDNGMSASLRGMPPHIPVMYNPVGRARGASSPGFAPGVVEIFGGGPGSERPDHWFNQRGRGGRGGCGGFGGGRRGGQACL